MFLRPRPPSALVFSILLFLFSLGSAQELEMIIQAGHREAVTDAFWLDDGRFVSASKDGSIKIWELETGKVRLSLWPPGDYVSGIGVNELIPTPQGVWAIYDNQSLVLWNLEKSTHEKIVKLPSAGWGQGRGEADASGRVYLYGTGKGIFEVGPEGQTKNWENKFTVDQLAVSKDGSRVAFSDSDGVHIGLKSERLIPETFANRWGVDDLALSDNGNTLFVACSTNWLECWDLTTNRVVYQVPVNSDAPPKSDLSGSGYSSKNLGLTLSRYDDKRLLAQTFDGTSLLVDKSDGSVTPLTKLSEYGIERAHVNPSGTAIVGSRTGSVKTGIPLAQLVKGKWKTSYYGGRTVPFYKMAIDGNRLFLAAGSVNRVICFDTDSGQPYGEYKTGYFPTIVAKSGVLYAGGNDGVLYCYDANTRKLKWKTSLSGMGARYGFGVHAMALSPTGTQVAVTSRSINSKTFILNTGDGSIEREISTKKVPQKLAFSNDGSQLFLALPSEVSVYDLAYRKLLHSWKLKGRFSSRVVALVNHPYDDAVLVLDSNGRLSTIDRHRLDLPPKIEDFRKVNRISSATLEGNRLLVCADRRALLVTLNGDVVQEFGQHLSSCTSALSVGGTVITSGWDYRVNIWDAKTAALRGTLIGLDKGKEWLITTPDFHFDGSEVAQSLIEWRWNGKCYDISRFFEKYHQPGLFSRLIGSSRADAPAAVAKIPKLGSEPPKVSLLEPKNLGNGQWQVSVEVEGESSGPQDVRLYHNGHRVPGQSPFKIKAVNGKNRLRASAFNTDRTVESIPDRRTFEVEAPAQKSTLHIFAAAVNDYPNPLDFAVEDAKSFLGAFKPGLYDEIKKTSLLDKQASKEQIVEALSKLECEPQDTLLVFLAGHGTIIEDRFHYLPYGADGTTSENALSSRELGQILSKLPATRQVLFLDTCHAGASAKDLADFLVDKERPLISSRRGSQFIRDQKLLARQAGTFLVAGSSPDATAAEVPQLGHGLFTYAVLNGLKDKESTSDQKVTVNELLRYLNQAVPELSMKFRGSPHGIWQFSAGQDFPIATP